MKTAILFSGQGAQYVGMGQSLYEHYPESKEIFDASGEVKDWCFEGPKEKLNQTQYTQPSIFTVSMAAWAALSTKGITPDYFAGFSLGEYSALVASGVMTFHEGLKLIIKRGQWMEEAAGKVKGGMAAVLGADRETVLSVIEKLKPFGLLQAVNFNCPGQIVIAGVEEALAEAVTAFKEVKAKCIKLPVSGAFHSEFMSEVSEKLEAQLKNINLQSPKVPILSNVTGQPYAFGEITSLIARQVKSPVLWEDTIRYLIGEGVTRFIEVGPGKVLTGLMKKIDQTVLSVNVEDHDSLCKALEIF